MKYKNTFFTAMISISLFTFSSCSGDDDNDLDDNSGMACSAFQSEYEDVNNALMAYSDNPGPQTCENYKEALMDFYTDFQDCAFWGAAYQEAVDEIQAIDCSDA